MRSEWRSRKRSIPARRRSRFSSGFSTLDNFKSVNDTLGHPIGDQLLLEVTKRLRNVIGSDMCSRMGGDEFGLIVCTSSRDDPGVIFDRYLEVLHEPFFVEGNRIEVRATIGYSSAPEDSTDADGLVMLADLALYEAKSTGRNRVGKFSPLLRARASARATALHELDRGIEEGQFDLHYQPQVDTQTGEVVAFEALLRWNHPSRGLIGPSQFISVAEETGMIIPLGAQAMAMATAAAAGVADRNRRLGQRFTSAVGVARVRCDGEESADGFGLASATAAARNHRDRCCGRSRDPGSLQAA